MVFTITSDLSFPGEVARTKTLDTNFQANMEEIVLVRWDQIVLLFANKVGKEQHSLSPQKNPCWASSEYTKDMTDHFLPNR